MSYRKLATICSFGSAAVSIVFSAAMMVATLGLGYLPFAVIVAVVAGSLTYLMIWLAWKFNGEKLSRLGHRW